MKIIDLLNKIAKGEEVPKKVKYNDIVWVYEERTQDYTYKNHGYVDKYLLQDILGGYDNTKTALDYEIEEIILVDNVFKEAEEKLQIEELKKEMSKLQSEIDLLSNEIGSYHNKIHSMRDRNNYMKEKLKEIHKSVNYLLEKESDK